MGMDIYATSPTDSKFDYFRANVWSWRSLHSFTQKYAGHLYSKKTDEAMRHNDGAGFTEEECNVVYPVLQLALNNMKKDKYKIPGIRGSLAKAYEIDKEQIQEWVNFVENSGGFEVH